MSGFDISWSPFNLKSDDDSGNDSDDSERSGKRRRFDDASIEKRRERRLWEENRWVQLIRKINCKKSVYDFILFFRHENLSKKKNNHNCADWK